MDGTTNFANDLKAYRSVEGLGASGQELMTMALDSVRLALLRAEAAIAVGDRSEKAAALGTAGRVVEFLLGLSGIDQGALSERLAKAYHYVMAAILKGNVEDDAKAIASGRVVIEHLAATWRDLFFAEAHPGAAAPHH